MGNEYEGTQLEPGSGTAAELAPVSLSGAGSEQRAELAAAYVEALPAGAALRPEAAVAGTVPEAAREAVKGAEQARGAMMPSDSGSHTNSAFASEGCRTGRGVPREAGTTSVAGRGA